MKGVILAAGHGTRLLPFTSYRPKHMLPVAGKPILHRSIEYMRDILDIKEVIIIVGYQRNSIIDYFKDGSDFGIDITYVVQHTNQAKGLAAAINLVEERISSDFIVQLGDNLFSANLKKVIQHHYDNNYAATLHIEEHENPERFGVVELDEKGNVLSLEEKPKHPKSNYVITGFYVLSPVIFKMFKGLKPSKRGEYELTDALQKLLDNDFKVNAIKIDGWRLDIGYPEDLLSVNKYFLNEKTHEIRGEVENSHIIPPVYISKSSVIKNSTVGPYSMIEGGVKIENSEISNTIILEQSVIHRCKISNSVVGTKSNLKGLKGHSLIVGDYSVISNGTF